MNRSVTQTSNYVALAGMVVLVLKYFGLDIAETDIITLLAGLSILAGLVTSVLNRLSKGDITVSGKYRE